MSTAASQENARATVPRSVRAPASLPSEFTTRLSGADVRERLEDGTLPANAKARRDGEDEYRLVTEIDEFSDLVKQSEPDEEMELEIVAQKPRSAPALYGLLAAAAVAAAALVGLGRLLLFR